MFSSFNINSRFKMQSSTTNIASSGAGSVLDQCNRQTNSFWVAFTVPILKSCARAFLQAASKYSPPGKNGKQLGTASIDPKYYYCRIIDLQKSLKDPDVKKRPRAEDFQWIRKGYRFKVISNKYREKAHWVLYTKTLGAAKRAARIKNRGLMKYSWGTLLNNFSGRSVREAKANGYLTETGNTILYETQLPATFRLLASKSPNMKRYRWGSITVNPIDMNNSVWQMHGRNYKTDTNAFNGIAVQRGYNAAVRQWKSLIQAKKTGAVRSLQRLLNFQINKIIIKHN